MSRLTDISLLPMPDIEEDSGLHEKEKNSPPPILRRRRNLLSEHHHQKMYSYDRNGHSDYLMQSFHQPSSSSHIDTEPLTPIKQLPFSPSQFFNSLTSESSWLRASTPKSSPGTLTTPQPSHLNRGITGKLLCL